MNASVSADGHVQIFSEQIGLANCWVDCFDVTVCDVAGTKPQPTEIQIDNN